MPRTQPTGPQPVPALPVPALPAPGPPVSGPPAPALPPVAVIRPADGGDAARISVFVSGLSLRSQFLRFFGSVSPPSSSVLRALSGAGGRADVLLATGEDGAVIGHAMAVDRTDGSGLLVSDIGLVVADSAQQHGIGARLLAALVTRAAGRGVSALVMDVQPENDRMLAMIERRWPGASRAYTADSVHIRSPLTRPRRDASTAGAPADPATPPAIPPSKGDHHAAVRPAA